MIWREYGREEKEVKTDVSFIFPGKRCSPVVRFGAVFYGAGGGAHCLLKWCFNGPSVTMAHTHTHTWSLWEREGRLEEREYKKRRAEERKTDVNVCMCGLTCTVQLAELGTGLNCPRRPLRRELFELRASLQPAVTSRVILKLLKRR